MGEERWFYRSDQEWKAIAERLKQTACPHCKVIGTLIRHGFLYGFDDSRPPRRTLRARRVFCSDRNARPGCGRTFSVWLADKIRRLSLSAGSLWQFLKRAAAGIAAAVRAAEGLSERTCYRVWKRFDLAQSKIRTALSARSPPPTLAAAHRPAAHRPAAHTLAHLHAAFPNTEGPIAHFQHSLRTFFM
ncbi:MAG TPA: hypothetical protein VKD72_06870 [Gemmataceae bacterium]|nr:hypothetical protein [Gemmataceae bacterium]